MKTQLDGHIELLTKLRKQMIKPDNEMLIRNPEHHAFLIEYIDEILANPDRLGPFMSLAHIIIATNPEMFINVMMNVMHKHEQKIRDSGEVRKNVDNN